MASAREKTGTMAETLCRRIADEIVDGALLPGVRLDEQGLAERFAVSRTPVREALRQLEAMGVVRRRPNRGVEVATVSETQLRDMFEAMAELEALCAGLGAVRMTAREKQALDRLHRRSADHVAAGAEAAYEEANRRFHELLYAGAHNAEIAAMAVSIRVRLAPFRRAQFRVAGRLERSFAEHDAVVRALLESDAAAAADAMRRHLNTVGLAADAYRRARGR
ncbi:MAG: GntR family transcriptional regulator [Rhodobacteraceae bacterium]|nr:MAG: GntR family transcriptional regulator [Paracoccaceae bacterium]